LKKVIGWILFVWGLAGIIANIIVSVMGHFSGIIIINTVICLIFIWGGWSLCHPKLKREDDGIRL
jgi:uncharacterized oligopeptide transporter (OPT) family protein